MTIKYRYIENMFSIIKICIFIETLILYLEKMKFSFIISLFIFLSVYSFKNMINHLHVNLAMIKTLFILPIVILDISISKSLYLISFFNSKSENIKYLY